MPFGCFEFLAVSYLSQPQKWIFLVCFSYLFKFVARTNPLQIERRGCLVYRCTFWLFQLFNYISSCIPSPLSHGLKKVRIKHSFFLLYEWIIRIFHLLYKNQTQKVTHCYAFFFSDFSYVLFWNFSKLREV